MGHYYRCQLLQKSFKELGFNCQLALNCVTENEENKHKIPYDVYIEGNCLEEAKKYKFFNSKIILDIYHKDNIKNINFKKYLSILKKRRNKIYFIEGLGIESCPSEYYEYIDTLITPYVIDKEPDKKHNITRLCGKDYLLLANDRITQQKKINESGKNILITFGGGDPYHQTVNLLETICLDNRFQSCKVRVVEGPLMSAEDKEKLYNFSTLLSLHNLVIENNLNNLKNCFEWADLVITNTGQTRYELAASGVPFIIYPFSSAGYEVSIIFEKMGAGVLENYPVNYSSKELNDSILNILGDYKRRLSMSACGKRNFFTINGANKLAKSILG